MARSRSAEVRIVSKNAFYKFKLVLLGDSGVGKSALAIRFNKDKFTDKFDATIGAAFSIPTLWVGRTGESGEQLDEAKVKLEIWDTAGQERFRSITPMYVRGAKAALVVYDITNRESYLQAKKWVTYLREAEISGLDNQRVIIAFAGNKADLAETRREVEWNEAQTYAAENGLIFTETSAKTGLNVKEVFHSIAKVLLEKEATAEEEEQKNAALERNDDGIRGVVLNRVEAVHEGARQRARKCCS